MLEEVVTEPKLIVSQKSRESLLSRNKSTDLHQAGAFHREAFFINKKKIFQLAKDGNMKRIDKVLEENIERINELDSKNMCPLHYACRYTRLGVVQGLLFYKGEYILV